MKPLVLYIAGSGRSGSTVLGRYFEDHLDSVHVGELRYVWQRGLDGDQLCECGVPFSACSFWRSVMKIAYPGGTDHVHRQMTKLPEHVDRLRHIPRNLIQSRRTVLSPTSATYRANLQPLYEAIGNVSVTKITIDSSKDPSYLFALAATGMLDLKVLHLVRDSRAVAFSWTRQKLRPEIHWQEELMSIHSPARSARQWVKCNMAVEIFRLAGPDVVRIRYEDFVENPHAVAKDAIQSLKLPPQVFRVKPLNQRHSFSGNPLRFDRNSLQVKGDFAWQKAMSRADRSRVGAITFPLLKKYGYPSW